MSQPRPPVFAANWKMCHGPNETEAFVERFTARHRRRGDATVVVFPPAISLAAFAAAAAGRYTSARSEPLRRKSTRSLPPSRTCRGKGGQNGAGVPKGSGRRA